MILHVLSQGLILLCNSSANRGVLILRGGGGELSDEPRSAPSREGKGSTEGPSDVHLQRVLFLAGCFDESERHGLVAEMT